MFDWINQKLRDEYLDFADYLVIPPSDIWIWRDDYASDAAYNTAITAIVTAFPFDNVHPAQSQYIDWATEIEASF